MSETTSNRPPRFVRSRDLLRGYYPVFLETGVALSLLLLVVAFKIDVRFEREFVIPDVEQAVVHLEEIEQTEHVVKPPPPPRPLPPVEVPDDVSLEDEILAIDAEIDFEAEAEIPPPPPDPVEDDDPNEIFVVVEEMPKLVGGMDRLRELVKYPEVAAKAGIEGQVIVQFVVEPDGSTSNLVVTHSVNAWLDQAAIRAIQRLEFVPGRQRNRPVRVKYYLPIRFSLTSRS